jgi:hypothetical protein
MSRRREPPPLIPPGTPRAGDRIGRRTFVQTAGGILIATSGLSGACQDKLPVLAAAPVPPDPAKSTVTVSAASVTVGGTTTLTLQAKDSSGNNLTTGGATVVFTASGGTATGTISATTDHGNGTYSAVYTATGAGTAQTIGATINGVAVTTTGPTVLVTAPVQTPDPTKCTMSTSAASVTVGGTATLTLQAKDSSGNNLTAGGATVVFSASGGTSTGTVSATTDHANGTYTAVYTATGAGTAQTIGATINGSAVTTTAPTVTVTAAAQTPDATKCTVTAAPASVSVGGTATLTLQAKDSTGTNLTAGGATVVFSASGGTSTGTVSATTDNGNGTYTAIYTGTAAGTAETIGATINGATVTTTMPTVTVTAGFASPDLLNASFEKTDGDGTLRPSGQWDGIDNYQSIFGNIPCSAGYTVGTSGSVTVTFHLSDSSGNPYVGYTPSSFVSTSGHGSFSGATASDSSGNCTVNFSNATAERTYVSVSMPSGYYCTNVRVDSSSGAAAGQIFNIFPDTSQHYSGSQSLKYTWAANALGTDASPELQVTFAGKDRVWFRFYLYLVAGWTIGIQKLITIKDSTDSVILADQDLCSTNDGYKFYFVSESNAAGAIIKHASEITTGTWHSFEIDLWRNGDTGLDGVTNLPSAAFWYDGTQIINPYGGGGDGPDKSTSDQTTFYWKNGRIYPGYPKYGRGTSAQIAEVRWVSTHNSPNSDSGTLWLDNLAMSSIGRIGP